MIRGLPRRDAGGFTLVELLVVIGIVALLIGLLMPALAKARQQAVTARCASNLRTLAQAWQMYVNSNQGVCVPGRLPTSGALGGVYSIGRGTEYRPHWYELLGAEVNQFANEHPTEVEDDTWQIFNPIFLCGAVPDYADNRNYVYGYNYQFLGNARKGPATSKWINYPIKASGINAAQTVMAADSLGTAAGKPASGRDGYHADGSKDPFAVMNKGWALDPPRLTADSDYADPQRRDPADRSGPDARHQHRCNVAFCDGHVQLLSPQELGYVVLGDGSIPVNAPGATNAMFSGNGKDADPPPVR